MLEGAPESILFCSEWEREMPVTNAWFVFLGDDSVILAVGDTKPKQMDELVNVAKLDMFVDKLPDMPKIYGFEMKNGVHVSKSLEIGMFIKRWVRFLFPELSPMPNFLIASRPLASIDRKSFGLNVKSSAIDEDGDAVLEWENLPPLVHISHCKAAPDLIYGCVPPALISLLNMARGKTSVSRQDVDGEPTRAQCRAEVRRHLVVLLPPLTMAREGHRLLLIGRRSNRLLRLRVYVDAHLRGIRRRSMHLMSP
ncbi:hypothetical protein Scep_016265 [Stephania cephalantha]|uniref:Uncharacterized protein n=1 Tax=Stephania cephalantha TaxID=152367 RepID=A0AAP0IP84_9MAGN